MRKPVDMRAVEAVFDLELARHGKAAALRAVVSQVQFGTPPRVMPIVERVAAAFRIKPERILGDGVDRHTCRARAVAMLLAQDAGLGVRDIARQFERNPGRVSRGIAQLQKLMGKDRMLGRLVDNLRRERVAA